MRYFVTGGAGFIGSNLVDRLLHGGHSVTVYDNYSTGREDFLVNASAHSGYREMHGDLLDTNRLGRILPDHDFVIHLAATTENAHGSKTPAKLLEQNTVATFNLLEAMRHCRLKRIAYASTGMVYGGVGNHPTAETTPFSPQTSVYSACKLAGEGLIQAYCAGFGLQSYLFRFASVLGERCSHGLVHHMASHLLQDPKRIELPGNGKERKTYLYVHDCVDAMLLAIEKSHDPVNVFNVAGDEHCTVDESLTWVCDKLGVKPRRHYTGKAHETVGDSAFIFLDGSRIRSLGWKPTCTIREGIHRTVTYLQTCQQKPTRKAA